MRIGWVGLGAMGAPMARNLIRGGFDVAVYNRSRTKEEELVALGADRAATPAEAASGSDILVTMVSDTDDVEEVLFGDGGALTGMRPGSLIIDMSTIDPGQTRAFAVRCRETQVGYVDAPVSGGTEGAAGGTLSIMCGGEPDDVATAMPVFEKLGKKIVHIGSVGDGQMAKAINQVIIAGTFMAVAEGMALGMKAALRMDRVVDALGAGAAASWVLTNRAPRMLEHDYPLGFKVSLHRKDLRIALAAATEAGLDLELAKKVASIEDRLMAAGLGDLDMSAIARAVEGLVD